MTRKRGELYEKLRRHRALYPEESVVVVIDRREPGGEKTIPLVDVKKIGRRYIELKDGTIIPLHRILDVRRRKQ